MTETFVAAKLYVENWRWADTPFYVRAGKRLPKRETTIAIQFTRRAAPAVRGAGERGPPAERARRPRPARRGRLARDRGEGAGPGDDDAHRDMDFLYGGAFRSDVPEAYERLILDCLLGDATLFTRADEVDEQWALDRRDQSAWARERPRLPELPAGTWGPPSADELLIATAAPGVATDVDHSRIEEALAAAPRGTATRRSSVRAR